MSEPAKAGRPRAFDRTDALEAAMRLFWRNGYEGTSLQALTEAMGINRPSLYAAFGDKQSLFRTAYEHYVQQELAFFHEALKKPTAYAVAEAFLRGGIAVATCDGGKGCMVTHAALVVSPDAEELKQWLAERRANGEAMLRKRMQRALRERDLPTGTDCRALAKALYSLQQGFNVQGAGGVPARDLYAAAALVLRRLPLRIDNP